MADKAELRALQSSTMAYSLDDFRVELRQMGPNQEVVEDQDETMSLAVEDARRELNTRAKVLGSGYPFALDSLLVNADSAWVSNATYVFLLLATVLTWNGRRTGIKLFEEVVAQALGAYIGGQSLRFGSPRTPPVPANASLALNHLARRLGERRASDTSVLPTDQDMGLDAVAWKDFPDRHPGKVILFGQCATGPRWREKIGEPSLDRWRGYIAYRATPVRVFAVPWTADTALREAMHGRGAIVFDRLRIAGCVPDARVDGKLLRWCRWNLRAD